MQGSFPTLVVAIAAVLSTRAPAFANDENVIHVIGRRSEREAVRAGGQVVAIEPKDLSRSDTDTHVQRTPSMEPARSSRINASGMSLPRVRGHDLRLTEVYVGDFLLQDPYTSFPIVSDLDLRAFGRLELMRGFTSAELPSTNPVGVVRLQWLNISEPQYSLGTKLGSPSGTSSWLLGDTGAQHEDLRARIYVRQSQTTGRYRYYDDAGTPYNTSDDLYASRTNNDQRAQLLLPMLQYQNGPHELRYFGIFSHADRGTPSYSATTQSLAREDRRYMFSGMSWRGDFAAWRFGFDLSLHDDEQNTDDPLGTALGTISTTGLDQSTRRVAARAAWQEDATHLQLVLEHSQAFVERYQNNSKNLDLTFATQAAHFAWIFTPLSWMRLDTKLFVKKRDEPLQGGAATWLIGPEDVYIFLQYANTQRAPSLWEQYGDGVRIEAAPEIFAETIRHSEFGGAAKLSRQLAVSSSVFVDQIDQRIVMVPIFANHMRAVNLSKTRTIGLEGEATWSARSSEASLFFSRLFPEDVSATTKQIPGVYALTGGASFKQGFGNWTWRWDALYRGTLFRDVANTIEIPASWFHATSLDWNWDAGYVDTKWGLAIQNVMNVESLPIQTSDGQQRGRVAYSDAWGDPLPGRQWQAFIELTF